MKTWMTATSIFLAMAIATPAMAAGAKSTKRKQAEAACRDEGLAGADLKACVKDKMKKTRKKKTK